MAEKIVVQAVGVGAYCEINHFENADSALRGALALSTITSAFTTGENKGEWADFIIDDLYGAHQLLLCAARVSLDKLWRDGWSAHARLGEYGEEAKERALREMSEEAPLTDAVTPA